MRWIHRSPCGTRHLRHIGAGLVLFGVAMLPGCTHHIEVHPLPSHPAQTSIPHSLQVAVSGLTIQGADHMPGITLLQWTPRDLAQAAQHYIRQRGTFTSVSGDTADLAMKLTTRLTMISRGPYVYTIHLHADVGTATEPIKSYDIERSATGSSVRWVTASDRDPIEEALQSSLEDLLTNIESDRALYLGKESVRGGKP